MLQGKSLKIKSRNRSMDFSCFSSLEAVGLPLVTVQRVEDVSGKNHSSPNLYTLVSFGAKTKITKVSILISTPKHLIYPAFAENYYIYQLKGNVLCRALPQWQKTIMSMHFGASLNTIDPRLSKNKNKENAR